MMAPAFVAGPASTSPPRPPELIPPLATPPAPASCGSFPAASVPHATARPTKSKDANGVLIMSLLYRHRDTDRNLRRLCHLVPNNYEWFRPGALQDR